MVRHPSMKEDQKSEYAPQEMHGVAVTFVVHMQASTHAWILYEVLTTILWTM